MPESQHRIGLVSCALHLGGSTTFLVNFAGELVRRNIPVEVFGLERENALAADFERQHVPVICVDQHKTIFEDRMVQALRQLAQFKPTVVISTLGAESFEVQRYLPAGIFRVGMAQSDDPLVYRMMHHYPRVLDMVAMVSRTMEHKARAMPEFAGVPVACLPYGVPMDAAVTSVPSDAAVPLRILYLGRLDQEQKRVRLFPQIFQHLVESGTPFHWTMAGDGSERAFLEANMKSDQSHQSVSFTGPVAYAAVPGLLQQHDIFLLASDYEGLPLSLLEAMGCGLVPVVSQLSSGISEVVDETNGMLVPVSNVNGYAKAVIHLHQHREQLTIKSAAARDRVLREFSVAAMTDRWLAVLPPKPKEINPWPHRWQIKAPLPAPNKLYFSPPVRVLRRLVLKLKG